MKDLSHDIKALFIKDKYCYGGPWASFNFRETSPQKILEHTFAKAGHPFPMILFMRMDCAIIDSGWRPKWLNDLTQRKPDFVNLVDNLSSGYCANDWSEIDFDKYDVVYSEDPIIPSEITDNHSSKFVCNFVEHYSESPTEHYDTFIKHWGTHVDRRSLAFPHSVERLSSFVPKEKDGIYIEYRTLSLDSHKKISDETGLGCLFNDSLRDCIFGMSDPLQNGLKYWSGLGKSRYHIMLPASEGVRLGQAMLDAAAVGSINIGICRDRKEVLHSECTCWNEDEAIKIVNRLQQDEALREEIKHYQYTSLIKNQSKFLEEIK